MTVPVLHGREVLLRRVEDRDHELILAWQNHPEVWWWMEYERTFTLEDIRESEARAKAEGHPFVIEAGGRPIGRIGLNQFSVRDETCSVYIFIGEPDLWGMGYGGDAMVTLLHWGFDTFGLHLVQPGACRRTFERSARTRRPGFASTGHCANARSRRTANATTARS